MARKQTEADKLAASLERQLKELNAQPSPIDVVKNITNPTASTREVNTYEEAVSRFSEIKNPDLETFSETEIPSIKFENNRKKVKPTEDPVIKQAEKLLK